MVSCVKEFIIRLLKMHVKNDDFLEICSKGYLGILIDIVIYHKVSGYLFLFVEKQNLWTYFSIEEKDKLVEDVVKNIQRTSLLWSEARNISYHLANSNLNFIFLKGISLLHSIYCGNLYHRFFGDIDILIREEDTDRIVKILNQLDFFQYDNNQKDRMVIVSSKELLYKKLFTHELYPFTKVYNKNLKVSLDINFQFSWKGSRNYSPVNIPFDTIYENRKFLSALNGYEMNSYDLLLHLCCHFYNEAIFFNFENTTAYRNICLNRLQDIYLMLKKYDINIDICKSLTEKYNAKDQVRYVFSLINYIYQDNNFREIYWNFIDEIGTYPFFFIKSDGEKINWPISIDQIIFNPFQKHEVAKSILL